MTIFLIVLLLVVVAGFAWLALQSGEIHVERSRVIDAPQETVFDTVRNFKTWVDWNPWLSYEPETEVTYADNPASVGGWYAWDGRLVGAGEMTHLNLTPHSAITDKIQFLRPMKSESETWWRFKPQGSGTEVTWGMGSRMPFFFRWMAPMISGSVSKDYDIGLAKLAMYVGDNRDPLKLEYTGRVEGEACQYVALHYAGGIDGMAAAMREGFQRLAKLVETHGMGQNGMPLSIYHKINPKTMWVDCEMAIPVSQPQAVDGLRVGSLPAQPYARTILTGNYQHLEKAWHAAFSYLRMQKWKHKKAAPLLERYVNDPQQMPPAEWQTYLDIPLR